jgi:hypothetical protein
MAILKLHRVVLFLWSSAVAYVGQWSGSTPAGCKVRRQVLQERELASDHKQKAIDGRIIM